MSTFKSELTETSANALNATATIFEVLAEVDAKFAKIAVKECGSMSAEVKKWFKKLAVSIQSASCQVFTP